MPRRVVVLLFTSLVAADLLYFLHNYSYDNQAVVARKLKLESVQNLANLPHNVSLGIREFLFFIGHGHSGHSIIGALLDAHPHIVIAHEFHWSSRFPELDQVPEKEWARNFFNLLYMKSVEDANKSRARSTKGYTLTVEGQWQGRFDRYIEVIGDKCSGTTRRSYMLDSEDFIRNYKRLLQLLSMPVKVIHAVRNPFDNIAAIQVLLNSTRVRNYHALKEDVKKESSSVKKSKVATNRVEAFFRGHDATVELIEEVFWRENVLEVHNCDLVDDPRGTISRIFQFLEVDTSEEYLDACVAKIFKSVSHSRDTVEWSPEVRKMVEEKMKDYLTFSRYSFTSD